MSATPLLTLLTDFGLQDTYVAQMHGVIAGIAPTARVIDLAHGIQPQNRLHAAVALVDAVEAFPDGTVHVVVVDPGVGSARRAIAAEIGPWRFVGPDNGVLTGVLDRWPLHRAVSLTKTRFFRPNVSRTFHGRDVFAPVAAQLATGVPMDELGEPFVDPLVRLDWPRPTMSARQITGQVLVVDRFGNLITNITADLLTTLGATGEGLRSPVLLATSEPVPDTREDTGGSKPAASGTRAPTVEVTAGLHTIGPVVGCYAERPGQPLALIGSSGRLEIAVGNGSAAETLQLGVGAKVNVQW
ncbi:MAG TPA: SAM-dependent chlorinase/fluorinase [Planctomycetaceae bacterium]|nr:SAM-dependent chlorinase/fluorinase [Planctomycetaceae bacterium]